MNISDEEQNEVLKVMKSQMLTLLHGEYVKKFEEEFAQRKPCSLNWRV